MNLPISLPEADELLCVVGPTASQKTELAIRICEQVGGEVVGADSVQIYKHFDLGSGKPTEEEQARARHHLVSVFEPLQPIDAAQYAEHANSIIADIRARGRIPVVCGGTFLWVRALVFGLAQAPKASPEVRARLEQEAKELGSPALHQRLLELDPVHGAQLSPNDFVRIQRALEVFEVTGRRLSDLHAEHKKQPPAHRARFVGIGWDKGQLEARIHLRAKHWLELGWIDEVKLLMQRGLGDARPMGSVGYRQIREHLEGKLDGGSLLLEITRKTKVFARRQRTWLREVPVTWLKPLD